MIDEFFVCLLRLSCFYTIWLYSDGRGSPKPQNPRNPFHSMGSSPMASQVWPIPALPDGSCLQRLRLGRPWLITFGQNLRRGRLRWASWRMGKRTWSFFFWCVKWFLVIGLWYISTVYMYIYIYSIAIAIFQQIHTHISTHEFSQILGWGVEKGFWALTWKHLFKGSESCPETPSIPVGNCQQSTDQKSDGTYTRRVLGCLEVAQGRVWWAVERLFDKWKWHLSNL